MILEGLVSTTGEQGECHLAPMGPITDLSLSKLLLRPFQSSTTYQNLKKNPSGVFHISDDVLLFAKLIVKLPDLSPKFSPAQVIKGNVLENCCRWYEFSVISINDEQERTEIEAEVVHSGRKRDFLGFNRAKHAVIEAAILASRVHILPDEEILSQLDSLEQPVQKTAGDQETEAFGLLKSFIHEQLLQKETHE